VALALPAAAKWLAPAAGAHVAGAGARERVGTPAEAAGPLPLELVGVSRPYTEADRVMLDEALNLPAGTGAK
jgi:hypothetical protein